MHALARQLRGEIDTKMKVLERLIQMADQAQSDLENAIDRAKTAGVFDEREVSASPSERHGAIENHRDSIQVSSASRQRHAKRELISTPALRSVDPSEDPRFERVYALSDAGFSAARIASHTGAQVGEVELILSLLAQGVAPGAILDDYPELELEDIRACQLSS